MKQALYFETIERKVRQEHLTSLLSQQVSEDPQIKEADKRVESSLGNRAEVQSARKLAETEAKKLKERKERKTQAEAGKDAPVPKKVTEGVSALKAWQQWLTQRQEQINKGKNVEETQMESQFPSIKHRSLCHFHTLSRKAASEIPITECRHIYFHARSRRARL